MKFTVFETKVGFYQNEDYNLNDKLVKKSIEIEKEEGCTISNVGGFHSLSLDISDIVFKKFIHNFVLPTIFKHLKDDYLFTDKADLYLDSSWININYKHSFNLQHTHPHSDFSFVYYCKAPENSGDLVLIRPEPTFEYLNFMKLAGKFNERSPSINGRVFIPPVDRRLIIFPANIPHHVKPNLTDEKRISIAGNVTVKI